MLAIDDLVNLVFTRDIMEVAALASTMSSEDDDHIANYPPRTKYALLAPSGEIGAEDGIRFSGETLKALRLRFSCFKHRALVVGQMSLTQDSQFSYPMKTMKTKR